MKLCLGTWAFSETWMWLGEMLGKVGTCLQFRDMEVCRKQQIAAEIFKCIAALLPPRCLTVIGLLHSLPIVHRRLLWRHGRSTFIIRHREGQLKGSAAHIQINWEFQATLILRVIYTFKGILGAIWPAVLALMQCNIHVKASWKRRYFYVP